MKNNTIKNGLENLSSARIEMNETIEKYFRAGGYENQMKLLSAAIQDIVNKGSGDTIESLDNEFVYTNRYIRESVYEITELQKFLIELNETYIRYRRCCEYLNKNVASDPNKFKLTKLS